MHWLIDTNTLNALRAAGATGPLETRQNAEFNVLAQRFPATTKLLVNRVESDGNETKIIETVVNATLRKRGGIAYFPVATYVLPSLATTPADVLRFHLMSGSNAATSHQVGIGPGADPFVTAKISAVFQNRTGPVAIGPIVFELSQV